MDTSGLPDMYTQSPRAEGVHIRQTSKLISREVLFTTRCEAVASLITLDNSQSLIICSVYRPPRPNNDVSYLQQLCSDLEGLINEHPNTQI